jgi:signal transduction histidine kinase
MREQLRAEEGQQVLEYGRVRWRSSLFAKLFRALLTVLFLQVFLAMGLTILVHRLLVARYVPLVDAAFVQQQMIGALAAVGLMAVVVAVIVAWFLSRYFTGPIHNIVLAAQQIFKGNLEVRVPVTSEDELGNLEQFFNGLVVRLHRARERDKAIARLKSQFVSVAAHQLRTPLTGIRWSLKSLLDGDAGPLTVRQRKTVEREFEAMAAMLELVGELLNVSRLEEGRFGYSFQWIVVDKLIEETVRNFNLAAKAGQVELVVEQQIAAGLKVIGDPTSMKLALANFVDNAVRYTKVGGKVTVKVIQTEEWLQVAVRDNGIGIPAEEQGQIFTKFFRAGNARTLRPSGSGLGLFLAKNVIEGHGGKVWFESEPGLGSTFYATLPLGRELEEVINQQRAEGLNEEQFS